MLKLWDTKGGYGFNPLDNSFTEEERFGAYVEFGIPISYELRFFHGFKAENVKQPQQNVSDFDIFSYTFGISYDTRDFKFNPEQDIMDDILLSEALMPLTRLS